MVSLPFPPLAQVSLCLGAGRTRPGDNVDHTVGVRLALKVGARVAEGQVWAVAHHAGELERPRAVSKAEKYKNVAS